MFRGKAAIISLPPERQDELRELLTDMPGGCTPEDLINALRPVTSHVVGPAFIGYAQTVLMPEEGPAVRKVTAKDKTAAAELRRACGALQWEHGGSDIRSPCSGVFLEGRLVALAGYEVWGGTIAHISIVTDPKFRGAGFGTTAVAHVANRAEAAGLISQYRTLEANTPSIRLAQSLGFECYATSLAVHLVRP